MLQLSDELNLELMAKIAQGDQGGRRARRARRTPSTPAPRSSTRWSRPAAPAGSAGAGFYDYDEAGKRGSIWPGLAELFPVADEQIPFQDIKDRMLFAEALETAKCFEEGVIESAAAANIGSIMGIGFPPMTGGAAQFMTGYEDPETGRPDRPRRVRGAGRRARRGVRRPVPATPYLRDLAAKGEGFPA